MMVELVSGLRGGDYIYIYIYVSDFICNNIYIFYYYSMSMPKIKCYYY